MSTLPAQNFITMPSTVKGTHYGLLFVAGGRIRSDFFIESAESGGEHRPCSSSCRRRPR